MFWWILGFITIALAIFLIYKRINSIAAKKPKEPQSETIAHNDVKPLPQIGTEAITSNISNLDEEGSTSNKQTRKEVSNIRQVVTTTHIEWTEELREIRRIMQLTPTKRKSSLGKVASATKKQYESNETLSIEELYKLAKQFAKLIDEADNLRNQGELTEERDFCINAIKWCAKNGLSVIYWQCRINQINKMEGRPAIKLDSVPSRKSDRYSSAQSITKKKPIDKSQLLGFSVSDFDNNISKLIEQGKIEQAIVLCQKMIELANVTKQNRYKEKAEKVLRIINNRDKKKKSKFTL
jgi:hypothetical protein